MNFRCLTTLSYFIYLFIDRQNAQPERQPGPRNGAETCNNYTDFWNLLFDEDMRKKIVDCTNEKIENVCAMMMADDQSMQTYHHTTDLVEINAFIGIAYYTGKWKSNHVDSKELWSNENGINFYRCVMPQNRFVFLASCLSFDMREDRCSTDRLSPIRELWEKFIKNCEFYYTPSNDITVDGQLLSFRGRCKFRMYIKSKPDKYGLKIIEMNDAQTFYMVIYLISYKYILFFVNYKIMKLIYLHINGIPYLGKSGHSSNESSQEFF